MYEVGDVVTLSWRVLDPTRRLVDATVTFTVVDPEGVAAPSSPTNVGVGTYIGSFVPTLPGRHVVRWRATGAATSAQTEIVNVASASDPVALISLDQLREHLNMSADQRDEDEELRRFLDAASLAVEEYTGQIWARRTLVEDVFVSGGIGYLRPPVQSVSAVTSLDGVTELTVPVDNQVNGFTGSAAGMTDGWARVTYVAGPAEIPEHVQTATAIVAAHLWTTQRPTTPSAPGMGGFDTAPPPAGRGYLIPNQAAQLLGGKASNRP